MAQDGTRPNGQDKPQSKRCKTCGVWYEDPANSFYKGKKGGDHLIGICKKCHLKWRKRRATPAPADHDCRMFSFVYDKTVNLWVCPVCTRPYLDIDPPYERQPLPFHRSLVDLWRPDLLPVPLMSSGSALNLRTLSSPFSPI